MEFSSPSHYFVPDVAYHLAEFERGFDRAINIQGSDHHGTVARVRIGLQAASKTLGISIPKTFPEYLLHKMLLVVKDGHPSWACLWSPARQRLSPWGC